MNNRFIIYDIKAKKVLFYSYDGSFIKDIKIDTHIRDIEYIYSTGGFLCAEYIHSPKSSGGVELWEVDSLGNKVNDLFVSDFIHPTASPLYVFHRNSNDKIIYSSLDDLTDYVYDDGKIFELTSYDVDGTVASDLKGMSNNEFSQLYWMENKNISFRTYTVIRENYEFTRWVGEVLGTSYYTLIDKNSNQIYCGKTIDYQLDNAQVIISAAQNKYKNSNLMVAKSNMKDVIVTSVSAYGISDSISLNQLGMSEEEADEANLIIQLLHVK